MSLLLAALLAVPALAGDPAVEAKARAAYKRIHSDFFDLDKGTPPDPLEVELGRQLFFDPRLSGNGAMSCATCHDPARAWGDGLRRGRGLGHKELSRNTPSLLAVHRNIPHPFFWDGRADTIEQAILTALQSRLEMDRDPRLLTVDLNRVPVYAEVFKKLYGPEGISPERLGKAIGAFIRAEIRPQEAPFDRYRDDANALSDSAKRGMDLFAGKARCLLCHTGSFLSDDFFHNVGLRPTPGLDDPGRGALVKEKHSQRAFRTPPLRDVERTGPWMHDGSEDSLEAIVEFYDRGGDVHDGSQDELVRPLGLTVGEKADLVAFLRSLTSPEREVTLPLLPPSRGPLTVEEAQAWSLSRAAAASAAAKAGRKDLAWAQATSLRELTAAWKRLGGAPCVERVDAAAAALQAAADQKAGTVPALAQAAVSAAAACVPRPLPDAPPARSASLWKDVDADIAAASKAVDAAAAFAAARGLPPGLGPEFTVPPLLAALADGRFGPASTEVLLQAVRFDVLRYYEYKAFLAGNPDVCKELRIEKIYFGIERTGDWSCRERHHENVLSHAFLTRPKDLEARCKASVGVSYPYLDSNDLLGACAIIAANMDGEGPCRKLIPRYLSPGKLDSCESFFGRFRANEDPASCEPLSTGPAAWHDRCLAFSAFARARKAKDWKLCEGRGLCLAFYGRREGMDDAEKKVREAALKALEQTWRADLTPRLEQARKLVDAGRARLQAADAASPSLTRASAGALDGRAEALVRLETRLGELASIPPAPLTDDSAKR